VQDVIGRAAAVLGRPVPYRDAARRPGDPDILVAAAERARRELGWVPRHSDLDTILRTAAATLPRPAVAQAMAGRTVLS
jgi:UDP-glucose 4-epimerase